jgi:glycosyltransferase involved in cell wall biosynthesis
MTPGGDAIGPGSEALPGPIMVVHNRYRQRAGEDAEVDAEIALLEAHGHEVARFLVDSRSIDEMRGPAGAVRLAAETVWSRRAARQLAAALARTRPAVVHVHNTLPLLSPSIYGPIGQSGAAVVQSLHNYRFVCPSANLFRDGRDCTDCVGRRVALPAIVHACYRDSRAQSAIVAGTLAASRLSKNRDRAVDAYIAPSRAVADALGGTAVPADRIIVKPNVLPADPGPGADGPRPDVHLYAGRLAVEKGVLGLPAAWRLLGDRRTVCRIAGDGPLAEGLAAEAAGDDRVTLLGRLDRAALDDELGSARALLFPSVWREPFGLSILEAFARATPVIAARAGAPAELVEDGVTGLHYEPGDPAALADRVAWSSDHPAEMAAMGAAARQVYESRYAAEASYAALVDVYRLALAHRRARASASRAVTPAGGGARG